jgi:hypothetical protein
LIDQNLIDHVPSVQVTSSREGYFHRLSHLDERQIGVIDTNA